jgi:hypothetical protein
MTRILVLGASGVVWAVMMVSLVRQEVFPYFDYQAPPSYRDLLRDLRIAEFTKGEIQAAGVRVGQIESLAERLLDGTVRIRTKANMRARIAGVGDPKGEGRGTSEMPLSMKGENTIDALYRLQRTWYEIDVGFGVATMQGVRDGDYLNVKLNIGSGAAVLGAVSQRVEVPKEGMIGDLFQPFPGGGSLFVGKKWKISTITMELTGPKLGWLYAAVTDREKILWQEQTIDTFRVEIRTEPTEEKRPTHISWIRDDGVALKQQFTFQSLVYDIVFVSKEAQSRGQAIGWSRKHFGAGP